MSESAQMTVRSAKSLQDGEREARFAKKFASEKVVLVYNAPPIVRRSSSSYPVSPAKGDDE